MITEYIKKVKGWVLKNRTDLLTALIIFLIGMASFGLGRLSIVLPQKEPIRLEDPGFSQEKQEEQQKEQQEQAADVPGPTALKNGAFVASKSGSVYYAVWCSGVSRIREENKVWFRTAQEAKIQGYRPAKNCPGL